ncbi:MAG TPA: hypothetical protein VEQ34_02250, partial [Pyrinomonadaceae bacterium]|nr:hypothetical protein [Pyrinomonadaceae bacterium]
MNLQAQKNCRLFVLTALLVFLGAFSVSAQAQNGNNLCAEYSDREVVVKLTNAAQLPAILEQYKLEFVSQFGSRAIYRLRFRQNNTNTVAQVVAALRAEIATPTSRLICADPNCKFCSPQAQGVSWTIGVSWT